VQLFYLKQRFAKCLWNETIVSCLPHVDESIQKQYEEQIKRIKNPLTVSECINQQLNTSYNSQSFEEFENKISELECSNENEEKEKRFLQNCSRLVISSTLARRELFLQIVSDRQLLPNLVACLQCDKPNCVEQFCAECYRFVYRRLNFFCQLCFIEAGSPFSNCKCPIS
jgi:hypothetical protein